MSVVQKCKKYAVLPIVFLVVTIASGQLSIVQSKPGAHQPFINCNKKPKESQPEKNKQIKDTCPQGGFIFENVGLKSILQELGRWYHQVLNTGVLLGVKRIMAHFPGVTKLKPYFII